MHMENGLKYPCQGKHKEFKNLAKTQDFFCSSCTFPDYKVQGIVIFAAKISGFEKSVLQMELLQISGKQGKFPVGQGNTGNLQIRFQWGSCLVRQVICPRQSPCTYS